MARTRTIEGVYGDDLARAILELLHAAGYRLPQKSNLTRCLRCGIRLEARAYCDPCRAAIAEPRDPVSEPRPIRYVASECGIGSTRVNEPRRVRGSARQSLAWREPSPGWENVVRALEDRG